MSNFIKYALLFLMAAFIIIYMISPDVYVRHNDKQTIVEQTQSKDGYKRTDVHFYYHKDENKQK